MRVDRGNAVMGAEELVIKSRREEEGMGSGGGGRRCVWGRGKGEGG